MGVDFITCPICEYNFPDCGDYSFCNSCETYFCSDICANLKYVLDENEEHVLDKYDQEKTSCLYCRKEDVSNDALLVFLMRHFLLTREDAIKLYYQHKDSAVNLPPLHLPSQ